MFLEKVKEIKRAEEAAVDKRINAQAKVKRLLEQAEQDGRELLAASETDAGTRASKMLSAARNKANEIAEKSLNDSKIEAVARKSEAELNIPTAVKMIIDELIAEWR